MQVAGDTRLLTGTEPSVQHCHMSVGSDAPLLDVSYLLMRYKGSKRVDWLPTHIIASPPSTVQRSCVERPPTSRSAQVTLVDGV